MADEKETLLANLVYPTSRQIALQRQLDNAEAKCANCKFWVKAEEKTTGQALPGNFGICNLYGVADVFGEMGAPYTFPTTDLAVCSKWEAK